MLTRYTTAYKTCTLYTRHEGPASTNLSYPFSTIKYDSSFWAVSNMKYRCAQGLTNAKFLPLPLLFKYPSIRDKTRWCEQEWLLPDTEAGGGRERERERRMRKTESVTVTICAAHGSGKYQCEYNNGHKYRHFSVQKSVKWRK